MLMKEMDDEIWRLIFSYHILPICRRVCRRLNIIELSLHYERLDRIKKISSCLDVFILNKNWEMALLASNDLGIFNICSFYTCVCMSIHGERYSLARNIICGYKWNESDIITAINVLILNRSIEGLLLVAKSVPTLRGTIMNMIMDSGDREIIYIVTGRLRYI